MHISILWDFESAVCEQAMSLPALYQQACRLHRQAMETIETGVADPVQVNSAYGLACLTCVLQVRRASRRHSNKLPDKIAGWQRDIAAMSGSCGSAGTIFQQ